jgi:hypothetical protein
LIQFPQNPLDSASSTLSINTGKFSIRNIQENLTQHLKDKERDDLVQSQLTFKELDNEGIVLF